MSDRDYPTEEELQRIESWSVNDPFGWLAFIRSIWWAADWGWSEDVTGDGRMYRISTGGWSGNEEIVAAMEATKDTSFGAHAHLFGLWGRHWYSSRRGGHYELLVKP